MYKPLREIDPSNHERRLKYIWVSLRSDFDTSEDLGKFGSRVLIVSSIHYIIPVYPLPR